MIVQRNMEVDEMTNEGRILEGAELELYSVLITKLDPIQDNHGTHCSDYHYETLDELSNVIYIIELTCGGGAELRLFSAIEYKEYLKPWSQKFDDLKKLAETKKPVVVQDYLTWPAPEKGLEGILRKIHDGKDGAERILSERRRQVSKEGWTPEHDSVHKDGQLTDAAIAYLMIDWIDERTSMLKYWPWEPEWFKPSSRIRDLEKAGALIAAEIDRLLRLERNDRRIVKKS